MIIGFTAPGQPRGVAVAVAPTSASTSAANTVRLVSTIGLTPTGELGASLAFENTAPVRQYGDARTCFGVLGTVTVKDDVFLGVVLDRQHVGVLRGAPVFRITRVGFFSLTTDEHDDYDYTRHTYIDSVLGVASSNTSSPYAATPNSPAIVSDLQPAAANAAAAVQNMFKLASSAISNAAKSNALSPTVDNSPSPNANGYDDESASIADDATNNLNSSDKHPCVAIMKLFSAGSFYYSEEYDLTSRCASWVDASTTDFFDRANSDFFWNANMLAPILNMRANDLSTGPRASLDRSGMLILAIQGFVGITTIHPAPSPIKLCIVSRLSCRNAGTRFNARGINDDGFVSNFVETEIIIDPTNLAFLASFVLIRGSIPVFWEQQGQGIQFQHRVELSRGFEASALAFKKHFETLENQYGQIHIVNLLGNGGAEATLASEYAKQVQQYNNDRDKKLYYSHFDYHGQVKAGGHERANLVLDQDRIKAHLDNWSYTLIETNKDKSEGVNPAMAHAVIKQQGVLRVNCLDCLDRTNHIQYIVARLMVDKILKEMELRDLFSYNSEAKDVFQDLYQNLWADNGDWLSKIYTGTGALKTSLTRRGKQTIMGLIDDAAKSVNRLYVNNVLDKHRQQAIDVVLGKQSAHSAKSRLLISSSSSTVENDLLNRKAEFVSTQQISVFVGTWNVNGKSPHGEPIEAWLQSRALSTPPHLVLIGIQELIELNAQQIVQVGGDTEKLRIMWDTHLMRVLNDHSNYGGGQYVSLRSASLLSSGLFGYLRRDCVENVRFVELAYCKTGLGGMAANKGGIGLSLQFHDTSIAFITAHLAAGEKSEEERNRDYNTITDGLNFKRKALKEHDLKFWFGDFNYRVNLPNNDARSFLDRGEIGPLLSHDQLSLSKARGYAFDGFTEAPIHFPPTYKYDNGTTVYDSSEKGRCPSWTDRILFAGKGIQCLEYTHSDNLLMSDHRPVRAAFSCQVELIDVNARNALKQAISKRNTPASALLFDYEQSDNVVGGGSSSSKGKTVAFSEQSVLHNLSNEQPSLIDFSDENTVWDSVPGG
ncbi:inositol polyphosphate 5-phosphatase [Physocladia obscura]|uniref:phosphoinositide 5-phosphatase n=1 Tax=Physocladia obscura TaxID=109957 RepID=A0AAD5T945_9FUNG|nr:inositol polyphosphate 5-phosphatase [Physocladia obscura]